MSLKGKSCYYCGHPATSWEHVPPKCLFPERKDAFGKDHRKNLITVPSCDEHNTAKSKEDEFLMACVTSIVGNNGAGYIQAKTKLNRAIENSNGRLLKETMSEQKAVTWVGPNGAKFPCLVGEVDFARLRNVLEHVARGLFFHATGHRFIGEIGILPSARYIKFTKDIDLAGSQLLVQQMTDKTIHTWPVYGDNPEIFRFHLEPVDPVGLRVMKMVFFRGTEVFAAFHPDGTKAPTDDQRTTFEITIPRTYWQWPGMEGSLPDKS